MTEFEWNNTEISHQVQRARSTALTRAAEHVLGVARELVPLDEGTLSRSGASDVDAMQGKATVSFDTVYAARQHEELGWRHAPGRQAKYLEQPFRTEAETAGRIIANEIGRGLE